MIRVAFQCCGLLGLSRTVLYSTAIDLDDLSQFILKLIVCLLEHRNHRRHHHEAYNGPVYVHVQALVCCCRVTVIQPSS
ncbi:uncharacterized protein BO95DRAFT_63532 [Aspergillus brunneoviolaceus CBS 621.78]|uniref:Uncharacterized protein n=1 Tax=Aspergillus brunneoviolaceus CBS 621.78 TaxID=1450534 RepID=A0ACD1GFI6_9EURO|nr:hypothetical protein BO95DRAFT_63532 [Aspergillus brunneoviolaceus CBS 621.78]RAH47991.1 hypothetical protein BO95DRAFT_63532 [Aspergillus brunneoviolaceus CBS 621.78]